MPYFIYQHILDNFIKFIKIGNFILLLIGWIGLFLKVPFPFSTICFLVNTILNLYFLFNTKRQRNWEIKILSIVNRYGWNYKI